MMKNEIQTRAEEIIREHPESRILNFTFDRKKYWIKRKMGNGRNQWIKYSVEKEFYYELARMRIAGEFHPELIPNLVLLTSDYMVTKDGGPTLKNMLDSDIPEEEKLSILKKAGAALASLHADGIIHGRPALRDIAYKDGKFTFLDWESRLYSKDREEQKAIDFLLLLHGIGRENYREEKGRIQALIDGYRENDGEKTIRNARDFLARHSIIGKLTHLLAPFKMKDIESVRKLYDYLT